MPILNVADEAVFKEWDDRVVRATTTTASLDATQACGNISKTQSTAMSNDPLSHEIGSGDRTRGGKVTRTKANVDRSDFAELDVDNAMENVGGDAETQGRNTAEQITTVGDTVNTASIDVSAAGPLNISTADPSTSTAMDIFEDEMMTIADTLVATRSTRTRTTSEIIHDVEEEPRRATSVPTVQSQDKGKGKMMEPEPTLKNPIKAQIQRDADIAQRLFE
ncbi:hypothetical protein Tco_0178493 [Tanacetum coccineum]